MGDRGGPRERLAWATVQAPPPVVPSGARGPSGEEGRPGAPDTGTGRRARGVEEDPGPARASEASKRPGVLAVPPSLRCLAAAFTSSSRWLVTEPAPGCPGALRDGQEETGLAALILTTPSEDCR